MKPDVRPRFVWVPRTGGWSLYRSWPMTTEECGQRIAVPEMPKPEGEWRYGFTRNPWDRVVSLYHASPTGESFRDFVRGGMAIYERDETLRLMAQPTVLWLVGTEMDFIGRYETREADLARLGEALGRPMPSAHRGRSERGPYREYYDEGTQLYVAERYAADIEAFGYTF